jgi:hypothetical protein
MLYLRILVLDFEGRIHTGTVPPGQRTQEPSSGCAWQHGMRLESTRFLTSRAALVSPTRGSLVAPRRYLLRRAGEGACSAGGRQGGRAFRTRQRPFLPLNYAARSHDEVLARPCRGEVVVRGRSRQRPARTGM